MPDCSSMFSVSSSMSVPIAALAPKLCIDWSPGPHQAMWCFCEHCERKSFWKDAVYIIPPDTSRAFVSPKNHISAPYDEKDKILGPLSSQNTKARKVINNLKLLIEVSVPDQDRKEK